MIIKIKKNLDNRSKNMYTILETAIVSNVFRSEKVATQYVVSNFSKKLKNHNIWRVVRVGRRSTIGNRVNC